MCCCEVSAPSYPLRRSSVKIPNPSMDLEGEWEEGVYKPSFFFQVFSTKVSVETQNWLKWQWIGAGEGEGLIFEGMTTSQLPMFQWMAPHTYSTNCTSEGIKFPLIKKRAWYRKRTCCEGGSGEAWGEVGGLELDMIICYCMHAWNSKRIHFKNKNKLKRTVTCLISKFFKKGHYSAWQTFIHRC